MRMMMAISKPTSAYIGASWLALGIGVLGFLIGLWNASMQLNEKGYYFATLCLGLYSAISLQKSVRDHIEGIPVSNLYYGISWLALGLSIMLISIGLWNAELVLSEKGFYGMAFALSLYAVISIQKNVRDLAQYREKYSEDDNVEEN